MSTRSHRDDKILPDHAVQYGDDLTDEGVDLVNRARRLHEDVLAFAISVADRVKSGRYTTQLAPDVAWCLRELQRYLDGGRKECHKADELAAKVAAALWLQEAQSGLHAESEHPDRLTGVLAVASVKAGQAANAPERGSPEWASLMEYLGVPPHARDSVSVRWPGLCEELTARAARGLPPPPGIPAERTYPTYGLQNVRLKTDRADRKKGQTDHG